MTTAKRGPWPEFNPSLTTVEMERFWQAVDRGPDCWVWTKARSQHDGRGQMRIQGRTMLAPRLAWVLTQGPIPAGICVLHRCDNPACVNPRHLFLGTQRDNHIDMVIKGRATRSRLSDEQVELIRAEAQASANRRELAERFGVTPAYISAIKTGRSRGPQTEPLQRVAFVGRTRCGCIVDAYIDDPRRAREVRRSVASMNRSGLSVERMRVEELQSRWTACPHRVSAQDSQEA